MKYRVAYRLRDVDHMDVTMDWDTREKAISEIVRLSAFHDLVKLTFQEIPA